MIGLPNHLRRPGRPGWALVGDAGYHRDPITGHGISDAFRDAELLATRSTVSSAATPTRRARSPATTPSATQQLREIFEITCELATYPAGRSLHRAAEATRPARSTPRPAILAARPLPRSLRRGLSVTFPTTKPAGATGNPPKRNHHHDHHRDQPDEPQRRRHGDAVRHARRRQAGARGGQFQFRAHNDWVNGTHNRSTIGDFFGVGEERAHERTFVFDADHPAVLVGQDNGPTPVEFVLHALAACLTAGLANIAAARKVTLTEVRSTVTGDIDLNGILGLNPEVRNGYQQINVKFTIKGDARPRCCATSSSSRGRAPRSTTSSPTACPSPSTSTWHDEPPCGGRPVRRVARRTGRDRDDG